jgi:tetratricopeptide (TPR) repeat protein
MNAVKTPMIGRMLQNITVALFSIWMLTACGHNSKSEITSKLNNQLTRLNENKSNNINTKSPIKLADSLRISLSEYVELNPNDTLSATYLYELAKINGDYFQNFHRSTDILTQLIQKFPDHRLREDAWFLKGYTFNNYLNNTDSAKTTYEAYLKAYPNGEYAESAGFEIKSMEMSPEEMIRQFENQNSDSN